VVVSGLARGIDGSVHEGAFPATIGVIASGIDIAYPPQHTNLQERIANEGLLLAEQPPGSESAEISSLLTTAPVAVDELICQSGASAAAVQMALLEIEIAGKLVRHAGARVSIRG
jgi:predicted Rossmann fold nucleotide-binding protein DprA/Smf involved in DNA uptake